jgi:lipopolysaccharide export system permease protein
MRVLRRYITGHLLGAWLLFGTILGVLLFLIRLIDELERVSDAYSPTEVILHVLLTLPQQLIMLVPVVLLIGSLAAFARLEQSGEMTIIRGSGITRHQFLGLLAPVMLVLAGLMWGAMEWVTAPLHQWGEEIRTEARGGDSLVAGQKLWSRSGNTFFRVGELRDGGQPGDIDIFRFGENNRLVQAIHARRAEVVEDRRWRLFDVRIRDDSGTVMKQTFREQLVVDGLWSREELSRLLLSLNSMPLSVLYAYSGYLERTGQLADPYRLAFWDRLILPFAGMAMVLLAIGLSSRPGSQRSSLGQQLGAGLLLGVVFYLGSRIVLALGQVLQLPPLAVVLFPLGCILAAGLFFYRRLNW